RSLVYRFTQEHQINSYDDLKALGLTPTPKQVKAVMARVARKNNPIDFATAFTHKFVADKFGAATTHWLKLEARVQRGVGNPCPLLLIGMPASIVSFNPTARIEEPPEDQEAAVE
ncbi:MAG: BglII/BstYI family type II restriction endonuclease, partial [Stenotrophobium sp.]